MEFLDLTSTLQELKALGVTQRADGRLVRLELHPKDEDEHPVQRLLIGAPATPGTPGTPATPGSPATPGTPGSNGLRIISAPRDSLPDFIDNILHRCHLAEVVLIPVGTWGAIVNLAAFDLAADDAWLEVDAEASLHQNTRNPLSVGSRDLHLAPVLTRSLLANADSDEHDLTIAATGMPLLLEFSGKHGRLLIWSNNPLLTDKIARCAPCPG